MLNEEGAVDVEQLIAEYTAVEPLLVRQLPAEQGRVNGFHKEASSDIWTRNVQTASKEALIMVTGPLTYSRLLETTAKVGDRHAFRTMFKHGLQVFDDADLTVGGFAPLVAPMYPTMDVMPPSIAEGEYLNAHEDYAEAVRFAGFDCVAAAGRYNAAAGARGILATEKTLREHGLVSSGLGLEKAPVFDVNEVKVAVLAYTRDMPDTRRALTDEGREALLNVFSADRVQRDVATAHGRGARFVLCYIDFSAADGTYRRSDRLDAARAAADAGVDYVVCASPNVLSRMAEHVTEDGRTVRIATGLGNFAGRPRTGQNADAAALRIAVSESKDGVISLRDSYVPFTRFSHFRGAVAASVPVQAAYHPRSRYDPDLFGPREKAIATKLGPDITSHEVRKILDSSYDAPQVSPEEICEILGVTFSRVDRLRLGRNYKKKVTNLGTRKIDLKPGGAAVNVQFGPNYQRDLIQMTVQDAIAAGAVMIISSTPCDELPCLVVPDPLAAFVKVVTAIARRYDAFTVAVTGTAGKTTTKELITRVFDQNFRTLYARGNKNTVPSSGMVAQLLDERDKAYVQEVNEGTPGVASTISKMIRPNVAIITSIGEGHLGQMGSMEAVVEGCTQVADGLREDGALIVNNDNEHLRDHEFPVRTIRYGIDDEQSDYRATNVRDRGDSVLFDVVDPDGEITAVTLNLQGIHNVSNALAAFAASREAQIPRQAIAAGLARYAPDSARQNLVEVGGYRLLVDTYSATPMSVVSAVKTLAGLHVGPEGRRVAVIGDIPDLGSDSRDSHFSVGREIGELDFDLLLCCGRHSQRIVDGALELGKDARFFADRDEFNREIVREIAPGDVVLFKGGTRVKLLELTVRPLFGKIA